MDGRDKLSVDRNAFSVTTLKEQDADEKAYWLSKTPDERLEAMELMRQINYDYDPSTARMEKVLQVCKRVD